MADGTRNDDKDWTWVLSKPCPECGFDADGLTRNQLAARVRAIGGAWREMLGRGAAVAQTPHDNARSWTILEYGCHVRDVFELAGGRVRLMLKKRKPPTFKDWNQEDAAADYAEQDPAKVAYELASNAGKLADLLDRVNGDEWDKRGSRRDGVEFSVETISRYMLHDVEHHLWDTHQILDGA